jgi:hypothetical protein
MGSFVDDEIYIEELLAQLRYACLEMLTRPAARRSMKYARRSTGKSTRHVPSFRA